MKRLLCAAGMMAGLGLAAVVTSPAGAEDPKKTPTVKEVMVAITKGPNAALGQTKKALGSTPPDWKAAKAAAVALRSHAPALAKNTPPKGEKSSWTKKAEAFGKDCVALADALDKEDLSAANAAQGRLGKSCMDCHRAHRPPPGPGR
jgi:cytochrome c556